MTVALLAKWGDQPPGTLFTSDPVTEAAMVTAKVATATLTGAIPWAPAVGSRVIGPAISLILDGNGQEVGITGADGTLSAITGRNAALQRPWRFGSFADSRGNTTSNSAITPAGSATSLNDQRGAWAAAYLGDAETVCNFGVSGDLASGWSAAARTGAKTLANMLSASGFPGGPIDACWVQYGINDYISGNSAATVTNSLKALCSALMGAGIKVIFESTLPASAANYGGGAAAELQATINGNAIMRDWIAGFPGKAAYANTFPFVIDDTGYASASYFSDGTHLNRLGSMISGFIVAQAARTLLPKKHGLAFTSGSLLRPNLIDWGLGPTMGVYPDQGTFTFSTPTWNMDADTGMPYAELTATVATLNAGRALLRFQTHATNISGATPLYTLAVGDLVQGSAYVVIDDGQGGLPPVQAVMLRQRAYFDSKFADFGAFIGAAGPNFVTPIAARLTTPTFALATASGAIAAPGSSAGYALETMVEFNSVGGSARIRVYVPSLRVISQAQPTQPAAGASPYTYTNTTGAPQMVYVAGGTVSSIAIARQGTSLTTGFTAGAFRLAQNDALTVTYSVAPTLTIVPDEAT